MTAKFYEKTKRIIAARSGYRCAFPGCYKVTIGPGADSNDSSMTGAASHIFSASEDGPRGTGGLSRKERRSVENGIWLCALHARVVDANRGDKFPPPLLRSYRDEHEARIAAENEGLPVHRVMKLEIGENPVFTRNTVVPLGKVTLLVGNNATGKSTIFRWIDQLGVSSQPYDTAHKSRTARIEYSAIFYTSARKVVRVNRDSDELRFLLNGEDVLFNPIPMEIINYERHFDLPMLESFLKRRRDQAGDSWEEELDDVDLLAEHMNVNPLVIPRLLPQVGRYVSSPYVRLRVDSSGPTRRIFGDDLNWKDGVSIHEISGSMASRSVLEMQIAMANLTAKVMPTILLINLAVLHFDSDNLEKYVNFFLSREVSFQVVFSTAESRLADRHHRFGWSILRLSGRAPNCQVEVG
jgi:energy-coupling factor transporter ATP-binding protein EcfA2